MKQIFLFKQRLVFLIKFLLDKKKSSILIRKTCIKNRILFFKVLILGILQSFIEGANIYFIYLIIALITGGNQYQNNIINKITNYLNFDNLFYSVSILISFLIIAQLINSLLKYFFVLNTENFTINIKTYIREYIYKRLFKFDYLTSSNIKIGKLLNLTIQVPEAIRERIEILSNVFVSSALLVSYIFILVKISSTLFFVIALFQFLVFYLQLIPRRYLRNTSKSINLCEESINNQLSEEIYSLKYLHSTGTLSEPVLNLREKLDTNHRLTMRLAKIRSALLPASQFIGIVILGIITLLSLFLFNKDGSLQAEKIVVFLFTLNRLNGKTSQIAESISFLAVNRGILNALDLFLDQSDKKFRDNNGNSNYIKKGPIAIKLSKLTYKYPGSNKNSLDNINLEIKSGEYAAIIGESGSGKTTLLDIILKLMEPKTGKVLINRKDLNEINSVHWQNSIGYVGQQSFIYSGTIFENIHMYSKNVNYELLQKCMEVINLNDFINDLPEKGNTLIGEGYRKISGGQMQKINIARALYREPSLLILDEATSNQDLENELVISNLINKLKGKMTIIVVAHRLNSITKADNIYLIRNGKIIESGNHETLTQSEGLYFNLWKTYKK